MNPFKSLFSLFLFCLTLASATESCSVTRVDSAAEITTKATAVIRVRAVGYKPENQFGGKVEFQVLEVLKGEFKQENVAFPGQTEKYYGPNEGKPPYNFVRPGGRRGNCSAQDYKMNSEFLLFLQNDSPYWSAMAATNEEISGANDPWVWWVKGYLAALPKDPAPPVK